MPHTSYLALGDSFSSGEGAYDYVDGTDSVDPKNGCHLSRDSYPYVAAATLGITDFHSVACSGATSSNYGSEQITDPAGKGHSKWLPGYLAQKKYLTQAGTTSVVTLTMGGNDIGFANKLKTCILSDDSCFHFREDRQAIADEIYSTFDTLTELYGNIRNDSGNKDAVKIYVLGYPQILATGPSCDANVPFSQEDLIYPCQVLRYFSIRHLATG